MRRSVYSYCNAVLIVSSFVVWITRASLLKVYLALHGFSVYIDIESLRIGRFDENLLISIRKSTNFILVLTANALDRCIGDTHCNDWVHKVCIICTRRDWQA